MAVEFSKETLKEFLNELLKNNSDYDYLVSYVFKGIPNITGKRLGQFADIQEVLKCIFCMDTTDEVSISKMTNLFISYVACIVALDILAATFKESGHKFQGEQASYRICYAHYYNNTPNSIELSFESVNTTVRTVFNWQFIISVDPDYPEYLNPLDRPIIVSGSGFGGRYLEKTIPCRKLNAAQIAQWIKEMEY